MKRVNKLQKTIMDLIQKNIDYNKQEVNRLESEINSFKSKALKSNASEKNNIKKIQLKTYIEGGISALEAVLEYSKSLKQDSEHKLVLIIGAAILDNLESVKRYNEMIANEPETSDDSIAQKMFHRTYIAGGLSALGELLDYIATLLNVKLEDIDVPPVR